MNLPLRSCLFVSFWTSVSTMVGAVNPELRYLENKGQGAGDFYAKTDCRLVTVRSGELGFYLYDGKQIEYFHEQFQHGLTEAGMPVNREKLKGQFIRLSFIGANPSAPTRHKKFPDYYNFFIGQNQANWKSKVNAYESIEYKNLYPGIHWLVTSQGKNLKYEFYVQPFCDPSVVKWKYEGEDNLSLDKNGNLAVKNAFGEHTELKPVCYQMKEGKKIYIRAHYVLQDNEVQIALDEEYDVSKELTLDPLLIFSTYSGSSADNWGSTATYGERGNLYSSGIVIGVTALQKLPVTPGVFQENFGRGTFDVAILKYDSAGEHLLYGTYLGGGRNETPHSLVMNSKNELLVLGTTSSFDFPITRGTVQRRFKGGDYVDNSVVDVDFPCDIFVAKISLDGSRLLACTYLGGTKNDGVNAQGSPLNKNYGDIFRGDIISQGDTIYISTVTSSPDFPTSGFSTAYKGGETDALIVSLSQDLTKINWANFIGGSGTDASHTIQIDERGNLFVAGGTTSLNFPISASAYQKTLKGGADGWMALLKKDGSRIIHSTYTGTSGFDQVYFIDLDRKGSVYVYGQTNSRSFPVTAGVYSNAGSGQFLQKFDSTLAVLNYSTVFGSGIGIPNISPTAFLVNGCGIIYMSGWGGEVNSGYWSSDTAGMPVTPEAIQTTTSGSDFYFCAFSDDASKLLYATFLGGTESRTHLDGGTCRFDKAGIVYHAVCSGCNFRNAANRATSDFPTTTSAYSNRNGSQNCNNLAFKLDLSLLKAVIRTNTPDGLNPGKNSFCVGAPVAFENLSFGGIEYRWVVDGVPITKLTKDSVTYKFKKEGTYLITLKAIDKGSCLGESNASTTVRINAPMGRAGGDKTICLGTSATLDASNGVTYRWTSEDGKEKYEGRNSAFPVSPQKTTAYFVNITDVNRCSAEGKVKVKVLPPVNLKWNIEYSGGCLGIPHIHIQNLSDSLAGTYIELGDGNTRKEADFWHDYSQDGTYLAKLKGERPPCRNELSRTIPIFELNIPNVFTPGTQDGLNDTFKIMARNQPAHELLKIKLVVVNRQGKPVYKSDDYKNDWSGNGLTGVYYYTLTASGSLSEKFECKSWVMINP